MGRCRFCKCHGDCRLANGDECMWRTKERNLCTRPECLMALEAELDAEQRYYRNRSRLIPAKKRALEKKSKALYTACGMRVTIMQVSCDVCEEHSRTFDMALESLSDVIAELKSKGWFRARGRCQDLCPACTMRIHGTPNSVGGVA